MMCPATHTHAATGTCYRHHGCRCLPCRQAEALARPKYPDERAFHTCDRCGMVREFSGRHVPLAWCRDCRDVEPEMWKKVKERTA